MRRAGEWLWLVILPALCAVLVSCATAKKIESPAVVDMATAELAHRVALDNAHVAAVENINGLIGWVFITGTGLLLLGLLIVAVGSLFIKQARIVFAGVGLAMVGVVLMAVSMAFTDHRSAISLGALVLLGAVLAGAATVGVYFAVRYFKSLKATVEAVESSKEMMPEGVKQAVFGENGSMSDALKGSPNTRRDIAKVRAKIKETPK